MLLQSLYWFFCYKEARSRKKNPLNLIWIIITESHVCACTHTGARTRALLKSANPCLQVHRGKLTSEASRKTAGRWAKLFPKLSKDMTLKKNRGRFLPDRNFLLFCKSVLLGQSSFWNQQISKVQKTMPFAIFCSTVPKYIRKSNLLQSHKPYSHPWRGRSCTAASKRPGIILHQEKILDKFWIKFGKIW